MPSGEPAHPLTAAAIMIKARAANRGLAIRGALRSRLAMFGSLVDPVEKGRVMIRLPSLVDKADCAVEIGIGDRRRIPAAVEFVDTVHEEGSSIVRRREIIVGTGKLIASYRPHQ